MLGFEHETARFADVGGLQNFKRWLGERQGAFMAGSKADMPRGVVLVGVQVAASAITRADQQVLLDCLFQSAICCR